MIAIAICDTIGIGIRIGIGIYNCEAIAIYDMTSDLRHDWNCDWDWFHCIDLTIIQNDYSLRTSTDLFRESQRN